MNKRDYKLVSEKPEAQLYADLIRGSSQNRPADGATGLMRPTNTLEEEQGFMDRFFEYMGYNSDEPDRVAGAVTGPRTPSMSGLVDLEGELLNPWFSLVPITDFLFRDRTEEAIPTMSSMGAAPRMPTSAATAPDMPEVDPLMAEGSTRGETPVSQQEGNAPDSALSVSEELYSPVGAAYRDDQIVSYSYYREPVQEGGIRGRSRKAGDAPQNVQRAAMEAIIQQGKAAGLSNEDIALTLAIARHESGFNPDAAAGTTSAHGLGQFVNDTGAAYGLTDENRWDLNEQARALVEHTRDNIRLAQRNNQGREYVYAYHHDGPSLAHGGLQIGRQNVMPRVADYLELVENYSGD